MLDITGEDRGNQPIGSTRTDPLFLKSEFTSPHSFNLLLSIIYNPKYNIYENYTRQDWFDILYIATYWGFEEIERLAMQQIELIDDRLLTQQSSVQLTRRLPSPTDTEVVEPEEDEALDMYVDETQPDPIMDLHEDTQEYSLGI